MASSRTFECPVCGEDVPAKARACPHCGACDKSGWNPESDAMDGLDLLEDDFDYEKFTAEEFGTPQKKRGKKFIFWMAGVILLVVTVAMTLFNFLFQ